MQQRVSPGNRLSGVDGMRAIAALAVFLTHLAAYWGLQGRLPGKLTQITELGAHGVDLFVVISGFCLALPAARASLSLDVRKFFIRRATRIGPPYYVALAFCAVLAVLPETSHLVVARQAGLGDVVVHGLLLQSLIPGEIGTINGSFWSIALEAQLYLVFPLLVFGWRKIGLGPVIAATALLSIAWFALGALHWWVLGDGHVIFDRLVQFAFGVLAASLVASNNVPRRGVLWSGLVAGGLLAAAASTANVGFGNSILWAVPAACAVLLAAHRFQHPLLGVPLERLGLISYSFYLLQQPVLLITSPLAHEVTNSPLVLLLIGLTACLALVIVASWLMYVTIEAPSIRLGARLTHRRALVPDHPLTQI